MKGRLFKSAFYEWIKDQPCVACGWVPDRVKKCQADHVGLPGAAGKVRSHKGHYAYACLPLCRACHERRHGMREEEFYNKHGVDIYTALALHLTRFLLAAEEGYLESYEEAQV